MTYASSQIMRALELLADFKLQYARLARSIQFLEDSLEGLVRAKNPSRSRISQKLGWQFDGTQGRHSRYVHATCMCQLQGEIHSSGQLSPSSDFLLLTIHVSSDLWTSSFTDDGLGVLYYTVQVLPFDTEII